MDPRLGAVVGPVLGGRRSPESVASRRCRENHATVSALLHRCTPHLEPLAHQGAGLAPEEGCCGLGVQLCRHAGIGAAREGHSRMARSQGTKNQRDPKRKTVL